MHTQVIWIWAGTVHSSEAVHHVTSGGTGPVQAQPPPQSTLAWHWPHTACTSCMRACWGHSHLGQEAQHMVRQLGKGRAALRPNEGGGEGPKGLQKAKQLDKATGKRKCSPVPQDEIRTCLGPSPFHSRQTELATAIASCPDPPLWPGRASPPSTSPSWRLLTLTPIPTSWVGLCRPDPRGKPPSPSEQ